MNVKTKNTSELSHPGFVLFEGMDFSGKSYISSRVVKLLRKNCLINVEYNGNKGFLNPNLADIKKIERMNPAEKVVYVLSCYEQDKLPKNPFYFNEILQDRYIPSIIFYGLIRAGMSLDKMFSLIGNIEKPKHIFLCVASYDDSVNRARERNIFTQLERRILEGSKDFMTMQQLYEDIIIRLDVPTTLVDTSKLNKEECIDYCISTIMEKHLMDYDVPILELCVNSFANVFPSTVELRKDDIKMNDIKPVVVKRIINSKDNYINLLDGGRHRAFAAYSLGKKSIQAHIKYEHGEFNVNELSPVSSFTFRKETNE